MKTAKVIKPTHGKWYLQEFTDVYTNIIRCNDGKGFETLYLATTGQSATDEARADAKMMAAAKDLHEVLNQMLFRKVSENKNPTTKMWNKALRAINKAEYTSKQKQQEIGAWQRS